MGPQPTGGGSDDIGDVSWNVPTVTLRFPSNIPGGPGHSHRDRLIVPEAVAVQAADSEYGRHDQCRTTSGFEDFSITAKKLGGGKRK